MKRALVSLAIFLALVSASFAGPKKHPAPKCTTAEAVTKLAPDTMTVRTRIEGAALAKLIDLSEGDLPAHTNLVLVFGEPDAPRYNIQVFVKGCNVGDGDITPGILASLADGEKV